MELNLKGLKITWVGLLLGLIGGIVSGCGSGQYTSSMASEYGAAAGSSPAASIGGIISIIGFILVIVGLSGAGKAFPRLKKARNMQIYSLITGIVLIVVLVVTAGVALVGSAGPGLAAAVIVMLVLAVLLVIFSILFFRNLTLGCADVAVLAGDETLAEKCRKIWRFYLIGLILFAIGIIVLVCGVLSMTFSGAIYYADSLTPSLGFLIPAAIILVVAAILLIISEILLLVRVAQLCSYDGTVPPAAQSSEAQEEPPASFPDPEQDNGGTESV